MAVSTNIRKSLAVIIPVFNGETFIAEAILSVLDQGYPSLEIIVVDDGSTDDTKKEVARFGEKVTYVYQENGGPAKARNTGILKAGSEYISFLDSDDNWHPKKLERQFEEFEKYKDLQITLGLKQNHHLQSIREIDIEEQTFEEPPIFNLSFGSALMKRKVFDIVGLLDEELWVGEDTDWFFRARENRIPISVHKDVVLFYRRHENNLTNTNRIGKSSILRVLKKAKDRKSHAEAVRIFGVNKPSDIDELIEMWNYAGHL